MPASAHVARITAGLVAHHGTAQPVDQLGRGYVINQEIQVPGIDRHGLWLWQNASWLATAGSWAIGALAVALIALGRAAYSNANTRRTVGILWDLGTFWPRATHPLAPPCYSERTMPDLINRTRWLAPGQRPHRWPGLP